jgi:magnesium-transporting ATPase (P-type)
VAEVLAVLSSIVLPFRLPFLPVRLLWLNLVTNGVQDIALAFAPAERDVLERPPRPRREGVISRLLWILTVLVGAVMAAGTLPLFLLKLRASDDIGRARTVAVTTIVVFPVVHVGNCRSEHRSAFALHPFSNPMLLVGTVLALGLHVGAMHRAPTQTLLHLEPLDVTTWMRIDAIVLTAIVAVEAHRLIVRRRPRSSGSTPGRRL